MKKTILVGFLCYVIQLSNTKFDFTDKLSWLVKKSISKVSIRKMKKMDGIPETRPAQKTQQQRQQQSSSSWFYAVVPYLLVYLVPVVLFLTKSSFLSLTFVLKVP